MSLWMGLLASVPCVVCTKLGINAQSQVHHMRDGNLGKRKSDYLTIALCPEHHTGNYSIHSGRKRFERQMGTELELLADTLQGIEDQLKKKGLR